MSRVPPDNNEKSRTNIAHRDKRDLEDALRSHGILATPYLLVGQVTVRFDHADVVRLAEILRSQ